MRSPMEQRVRPQTRAIFASASVKPPSGPVTTLAVLNSPAASIACFSGERPSPVSYMKSFASAYEEADNRDTFRFGMITALCSALIYAAVTLANVLIINPDLIHQQIEAALKIYGSSLDSNSLNALDEVESIMPQVMFFSNLVYCYLFGTVLSAVLSRNIPPRNPFDIAEGRDGDSGDAE